MLLDKKEKLNKHVSKEIANMLFGKNKSWIDKSVKKKKS